MKHSLTWSIISFSPILWSVLSSSIIPWHFHIESTTQRKEKKERNPIPTPLLCIRILVLFSQSFVSNPAFSSTFPIYFHPSSCLSPWLCSKSCWHKPLGILPFSDLLSFSWYNTGRRAVLIACFIYSSLFLSLYSLFLSFLVLRNNYLPIEEKEIVSLARNAPSQWQSSPFLLATSFIVTIRFLPLHCFAKRVLSHSSFPSSSRLLFPLSFSWILLLSDKIAQEESSTFLHLTFPLHLYCILWFFLSLPSNHFLSALRNIVFKWGEMQLPATSS